MTELAFWTAITILSAACGGGFLYLMSRVSKSNESLTSLTIEVDRNKADIKRKPDKDYLYENFHDKEKIDIFVKNIEHSIKDLSDSQKSMNDKLDAVLIKNNGGQ
ncbi:hypothetical protein KAR91_35955 [Candidatus Pacearchaeota archaeon]|nr:hypothetical protein [Candidatus Pacearchaeota archaeon]